MILIFHYYEMKFKFDLPPLSFFFFFTGQVQFNKTANNTFFVQSRAQGRMMAIGDSSFEPRGDGRIFASTGDNRIGSPVIAVVDPDDATLWNVSRSAFNYAALT